MKQVGGYIDKNIVFLGGKIQKQWEAGEREKNFYSNTLWKRRGERERVKKE